MRRVRRVLVRQARPRPAGQAVQVTLKSGDIMQSFLIMPGEMVNTYLMGYGTTGTEIKIVNLPVSVQARVI